MQNKYLYLLSTDSLTLVAHLPQDLTVFLNNRGAYAVEANTGASFACFGVLNDANIELNHSAIDLDLNNRTELPYGPIVVQFNSTIVDGNLTCRSRTSGREESVYIGGTVHMYIYLSMDVMV